jgi:hypothetical protein
MRRVVCKGRADVAKCRQNCANPRFVHLVIPLIRGNLEVYKPI